MALTIIGFSPRREEPAVNFSSLVCRVAQAACKW
jgi:hypothetical protein